ncbi:MAG TPA: hypothetical protein PK299_02760, partial [Anaerolineales bacterium]|nr:hypothetical protein [Anaerolineales bacterium]
EYNDSSEFGAHKIGRNPFDRVRFAFSEKLNRTRISKPQNKASAQSGRANGLRYLRWGGRHWREIAKRPKMPVV